MKDGIFKVALGSPNIRVADVDGNSAAAAELVRRAADAGAKILVLPELTLTGSTAGDLFFQSTLISGAEKALAKFLEQTREFDIITFIGLPVLLCDRLYNAVCAVSRGQILGVSASECETRHFAAISQPMPITLAGVDTVIAPNLIFESNTSPSVRIFAEIGEDADAVIPPSSYAALAGANIIVNPYAQTEYIGFSDKQRCRVDSASARLKAAYIAVGAGEGESGTDGIYAARRVAAQCGQNLLCSEPFSSDLLLCDVDALEISSARRMNSDFKRSDCDDFEIIPFDLYSEKTEISSPPRKLPFVAEDEIVRKKECALALDIQSRALAHRIERAYAKCCVIGVSGGLDSTLAVLAAAYAMDVLGRDRSGVIAVTMPCFGTTERTKNNALALAEALGCSVRTVDIKESVLCHFKDISHDPSNYNVVYENAQARERTQVLMDIANEEGGFVVGTGDLSELALGFATYNGDHMSMYGVNASIPKTLMRAVIRYAADAAEADGDMTLARTLRDVVDTPISPELLPLEDGVNTQHTESIVGPYELHDFFLWYFVGKGYSPDKIMKLALSAFSDEYSEAEIKKYLDVFVSRFFSQQFKRSCLPDGPRVTEISLSPRTSFVMPSDSVARLWKK